MGRFLGLANLSPPQSPFMGRFLGLANLSPPQSPPLGGKLGSSPQRGEVGRGESPVSRKRPDLGIRFRRCPVCCRLDPQKPTHERGGAGG